MNSHNKPNILFVFSDQHRWCDLNCYGNSQINSPNFNAFYNQAAAFTNCISNSPVCVPARGSLMTGLFPIKHRAVSNDLPINNELESIAAVMNDNGYNTGYIGKWHLAGIPRDQAVTKEKRLGFKKWKVCNCNHNYLKGYYYDEDNNYHDIDGYEPMEQTNLAIDFIKRNKGTNWGLVLSWGPPHDPYPFVPQKYLDLYEDVDIKLRPNVTEKIMCRTDKFTTKAEMTESMKGYYAHITALDEQFGRLIEALEKTGQLDDTIVVYTSDHGDMLGSHGHINKQWHYNESVKVPLMVYWKGKTINIVSDEMIGLVDLPVSLLSLAGMRFNSKVDGQDLHKLFTDEEAKGLDSCYIMDHIPCHQAYHRGGSEWRGIITKEYTFAKTGNNEKFALYNNQLDPYQMENLIDNPKYEHKKQQLDKELDTYINQQDKLLPFEAFIKYFGLTEEWNKSQSYFKLPLLEE